MLRLLIFFLILFSSSYPLLRQENLEGIFEDAKNFRKENNIDSSIILFEKLIDIESQATNITKLTSGSLNYLGLISSNRNEKEQALDYFYESIKINKEIENKSGLVSNYNSLANYYSLDNKKLALEYYQKAIDLLPYQKEEKKSGILNMNIGNIFSSKDFERFDYDSAVYYFLNALKSFQTINDSANISLLFHNLGYLYEKNENLNVALNSYENSLKFHQLINLSSFFHLFPLSKYNTQRAH